MELFCNMLCDRDYLILKEVVIDLFINQAFNL